MKVDTAVPKEYVAVLRCQTWHIWPAMTVVEIPRFSINDAGVLHPARLAILAYEPRTEPAQYLNEDSKRGPLIWDGDHGLYRIWDVVLKAPEDRIPVTFQHRYAYRGEVDVGLNFFWVGECDEACVEMLRTALCAIVAILNVHLADILTPTAPLSVREVLPKEAAALSAAIPISIRSRRTLTKEDLGSALTRAVDLVQHAPERSKLETALELYEAHFTEKQARVRFLLLVLAFETLTHPTPKHATALALLDRWRVELESHMSLCQAGSEDFVGMEALMRELFFRKEDYHPIASAKALCRHPRPGS